MGRIMLPAFVLEGWRRGITVGVAAMGRIGPRKNRREVAGLAAGPMGPMTDRTPDMQPAAISTLSPNG